MFYPYSTQLRTAAKSFSKGNFSLWFNKLIPLNNENNCKPCDQHGKDKEAVQYYESFYNNGLKNNQTLKSLLDEKQKSQQQFCKTYEKAGYKIIKYQAELKSPLITGIGQTHPNEVGMVFDHTMGIPFIPAASVKGIVRFAHMLGLIDSDDASEFIKQGDKGEYIEESNPKTLIPFLFGGDLDKPGKKETEKRSGKVIFLDAYPVKVPDLHVDIMNPHYGDYYSDENGKIPPADYLDPTPIKFLTVKQGTVFTFRALISKNSGFLLEPLKTAFENALKDEGVGAKTAVGYGRFEIERASNAEIGVIEGESKKSREPRVKTALGKMLDALNLLKSNEIGKISGEIVNNMEKELKTDEEKIKLSKAIKEKLDKKAFNKLDKNKNRYLSECIAKEQK